MEKGEYLLRAYFLLRWFIVCGIAAMAILTCSNPIDKRVNKPQLSIVSDTIVSVKDSIVLRVYDVAGNGKAVNYIWSLDSRSLGGISKPDSICHLFFGIRDTGAHTIIVTGISAANIPSDPETAKVTVLLHPPVVRRITKDTSINANDSIIIVAQGIDSNGSVIAYTWLIDTSKVPLVTTSGILPCFFGALALTHVVRFCALDSDSILSAPDSVHVRVIVDPPEITVQHGLAIPINDTLVIHATRLDTFSSSVRWLWARNGTTFSDTTTADSLKVRFGRLEAGSQLVLVKAVDSHLIESNADSVRIQVHLDRPTASLVHDTIVPVNDPAVLHVRGADTNGNIIKYVWALDGTHFGDTTAADSIATVYSRADTGKKIVVLVKAFDDDTLESNIDSVHIVVHLKPSPQVAISGDTNVFINDSFIVTAKGVESSSQSPVVEYVWAVDKTLFADTTKGGNIPLCFSRHSAGQHIIRVKSVDRDTMESLPESLIVQVLLGTPVVAGMKDTAVFINDTAFLHMSGTDTNGTVVRYAWAFDGGSFTDTTTAGALKKVWGKQDAGIHVVRAIAIDNDTLSSAPSPCTVMVRLGTPVIRPVHDTAVTWGATVAVALSANDTNGTIVEYLQDSAGTGAWTDSSAHDTLRFTSMTHCRKMAVVGVRDDDGLIAKDTFFIDYRAVPCTVTAGGPKTVDTAYCISKNHRALSTPLSFPASRVDGINDTFAYSLWTGPSAAALAQAYQGSRPVCSLKTVDTGTYYWRVVAVDTHNDTAETPLSALSVLWQRRICFIGHSIMVGLGGDANLGGLRRMVIDTLRANAAVGKEVWCEGPLTTPAQLPGMSPVQDDSILAVSGKTCADIYDSLRVYASTFADIWVYMNGANEGYRFPIRDNKYITANYSTVTIDSMHGRNPQSEIYVFNALPYPADTNACFTINIDTIFTNHLPTFNQMLDTAITHRCQTWQSKGEAGVWLVDVHTPMGLPTGGNIYNPAYFFDCLHPNQTGYNLMAGELFKVMRTKAKSSFIK